MLKILLLALLLLPATLGAQTFSPGHLPARHLFDTRFIVQDSTYWEPTAKAALRNLVETSKRLHVEGALCLYGDIHWIADRRMKLHIGEAKEPSVVQKADSVGVVFSCLRNPFYLGTVHTHVLEQKHGWAPSRLDFAGIMFQEYAIVHFIVHVPTEAVYMQFKDGRWMVYLPKGE